MSQERLPVGTEVLKDLLRPHKTIRDPVHGDMMINHLETEIIDTRDFQRLEGHKQLGLTNLVYPGAVHTRRGHSLGTLHIAQFMVDKINSNPYPGRPIKDFYEILLIRTCALLHDFVNYPFGHTIEDEGNLEREDWSDSKRVERFLSPKSEVGRILVERVGEKFLRDVTETLSAETPKEMLSLRYPFAAEIVGNTICADLLDYLRRDNYFCGLSEIYDNRFLNYLFIDEDTNRVALRAWWKGRKKDDVLSEAIKLLRTRYALAQKVYFHHTKVALSAMLIEAISGSPDLMKSDSTFELGDDGVLEWLESKGSSISKSLVSGIRSRRVYKPIYIVKYAQRRATEETASKVERLVERFRKPKERREFARLLENWSQLPGGSLILYCPDKGMNIKAADALVEWYDKRLIPLQEIEDEVYKEEIKLIQEQHRRLWSFQVLINPAYLKEPYVGNVVSDCIRELDLGNDADRLQHPTASTPFDRRIPLLNKHLIEKGEKQLMYGEIEVLRNSSNEYTSSLDIANQPRFLPSIEWFYEQLKAIRRAQ